MLAKLMESLKNLWEKENKHQIYYKIPVAHVDNKKDYVKLKEGNYYVKLYMVQMFLKNRVQYLQSWFPAVHSLVRFDFQGEPVIVPNVADSTKIGAEVEGNGDVIARNFELTPQIPFNSGSINLQAGLLAIQGQNYLNSFIKTLSDFSSLLAVPQFSAALKVAEPLATGLQSMISAGGLHLALHDTFGSSDMGGYFVAIRATENDLVKESLRVDKSQLRHLNGGKSEPFEAFDYMLFRIDVSNHRFDWDMMDSIQEPMKKVLDALEDLEDEKAESYLRQAIIAAHTAPELTKADRTAVKLKIKQDFEELKKDLGYSNLVGGEEYSLAASMKLAMKPADALKRGDPSFLELLG